MPSLISEDDIEQEVLKTLQAQYGFTLLNCFTPNPDDLNDGSHRSDKRDVILRVGEASLWENRLISGKLSVEDLDIQLPPSMTEIAKCETNG